MKMRKLLKLQWIKPKIWWTVVVLVVLTMVVDVASLSGPNVCMVKQKYNITKRVKYRAPMSVRTYEWCLNMPPRCSKWTTEMRDVTRLETEERTAEMAVCCPGYKLRDVSCVPSCPSGKTGQGCAEDCPPSKWGPSCMHECKKCEHGYCDATTGQCRCQDGWQGESCETGMTTTATAVMMEQLLTTETATTKTTTQTTSSLVTRSNPVIITTPTLKSSPVTSTEKTTSTSTTTTTKPSSKITTTTTSQTGPTTIATLTTTKTHITEVTTMPATLESSTISRNVPLSSVPVSNLNHLTVTNTGDETTKFTNILSNYNRTEVIGETRKTMTATKSTILVTSMNPATVKAHISKSTITPTYTNWTTALTLTTSTMKPETNKVETTIKQSTTTKIKPKEIWIKPTQKGESPIIEIKNKSSQETPHFKSKSKVISEITTPKTIVVSIIPTSVTYVTFKKLALTTVSSMTHKSKSDIVTDNHSTKITGQESVKTILHSTPKTTASTTVKTFSTTAHSQPTLKPSFLADMTNSITYKSTTREIAKATTPTIQTTNSMPTSTLNVANKRLNSILLTTVSSFVTNATRPSRTQYSLPEISTNKNHGNVSSQTQTSQVAQSTTTKSPKPTTVQNVLISTIQRNITRSVTETTRRPQVTKTLVAKQVNKTQYINNQENFTVFNLTTNIVTDQPLEDEETFHILTEPEHITAVMSDKGQERSTINLISVISIAGGVMLAVITVAVVIVMLDRCKKPRYEDVRKYNDIRMQVMIDNNDDIPPPYVRSIFHTPLPDPPTSEKCHYQPISTLDRNLKQFMRPVVVQSISPLMLENFRGILECHYDHLPRRSQDIGTIPTRYSGAPSIDERQELLPPPRVHSLTDSDIEAMKCEAKLDEIDSTTSEPLYAEIPCWRPPSAHAIEVVNINGEAVTEL